MMTDSRSDLPSAEERPANGGWMVHSMILELATGGHDQILDVTPNVRQAVTESGIENGQVLIFIPGATASVTTIEYEPGLQSDLPWLLEKLIPAQREWQHNQTWGDGNGSAHLRASLIGPSLTVPVIQGQLVLGTWQQVVVIDHDNRGRNRSLMIQVSGQFQPESKKSAF